MPFNHHLRRALHSFHKKCVFPLVLTALLSQKLFALGETNLVGYAPANGDFALCEAAPATIWVATNDWPGVIRAAGDLANDLKSVTGQRAQVSPPSNSAAKNVVIIGTIGRSEGIDRLIRDKKIDVSDIAGKWESFFLQVVPHPFPGIDNALVICGSDKRGTIYGIYDLSEQIGVSPWHFFADVPAQQHKQLFVKPGRYVQGPPAVKYRGIFINDEAPDLTGWVKGKFGQAPGHAPAANYGPGFYTNVFELILRLRGNYLWPAMWDNAFNEDDPENPRLADEYGVVMGTSHHEPMLRAQQEWKRHGTGDWNYAANRQVLSNFWRLGVERNKNFESIITLGMRGDGDVAMSENANVSLLEKIVADQRAILEDVFQTNAGTVPQLWALYKEVQEYYEKGMRVPDDVTLLLCDDNWGDVRRLPAPADRTRSGGAGIYYHFDYVGGPRNYKWVNTVQNEKTWEQMNLAYHYGADRIWIVNVGHLQHVQFPMEFFLTFAWNPAAWPKERIAEFTELWAEREFGKEFAPQIADIISKYTKYNSRRKPELLSPDTFSLVNYQEADTVLADWNKIADAAADVYQKLPAERRDAFFELVLYPVKASANLNALYIAVAKNRFLAGQNNAKANDYAAEAKTYFETDASLSDYYNHTLAGGKWNHMMDQTHIGYTNWQEPPKNIMPKVFIVTNATAADFDWNALGAPQPAAAIPDDANGFIESDGYVSIEAEHFTRNVPAGDVRWEKIPNLGRTLSAMSIFPVTAASVAPPENSPRLEYQMFLTTTGTVNVKVYLSPSLNFMAGRGARFAISLDDESPETIVAVPENYVVGDRGQNWERTAADSIRKVPVKFDLKTSGEHTLKIWMVDPGIVLQKIVVDCGGEKPSYLGPPESRRK